MMPHPAVCLSVPLSVPKHARHPLWEQLTPVPRGRDVLLAVVVERVKADYGLLENA